MKYTTILLILLISSVSIWAQNGSIRGFVTEKKSGEPIIFTSVYLDNTTFGIATDVNGYYSLSKLPPGDYTLISTGLGFDTARVSIKILANQTKTVNMELGKASKKLGTVTIDVERKDNQTSVKTSVVKISPKQIAQIPSIGGQPEIAQYIQVLPGVVFTGDQGGQLFIRGGSPIQNKVLMDGLVIYNPFHSIGLFSVFDSDIIRNADVYTGGFNAKYGGRISSIMDITMKNGNKSEVHGQLTASPFLSKVMVEGPLKKATEDSPGSLTYILSAKQGLLDQTSPELYSYANNGDGLPFTFRDLYGKISSSGKSGSRFNIFGFNFSDGVDDYQAVDSLGWSSGGVGTNFVLIPGASNLLVEGKFGYSNFTTQLVEESGRNRTSFIGGFNGGLDFTYLNGEDAIKYGFEFLGFKTDFAYVNSIGRRIEQNVNTSEMSGYFNYKKKLGLLIIDPSFRIHYYASLPNTSLEPRLGIKYNINENFRWKFAGGYFSQNLIAATSERDVVSLFSGYLSGSDEIPDEFDGESLEDNKLQKARHIISGFEYDFKKFTFNLEGYYKFFDQLSSLNRNKMTEAESDFMIETGKAYGLDFNMKYDDTKLYIWFVYSHGYVKRFDGTQEYWTHFDRRHNLNLVTAYKFGKKKSWEVNLRWNYGSGFPFTPTAGNYEMLNFSDGLNSDFTTENGNHQFILGDINSKRLPEYHRLDFNMKKTMEFEKSKLAINLGVTNVYNRGNIFYIDRASNERINQLPIMPSLGVNFNF